MYTTLLVKEGRSGGTPGWLSMISTLDSGIDVAPGINVASGTFGKNIKHSP